MKNLSNIVLLVVALATNLRAVHSFFAKPLPLKQTKTIVRTMPRGGNNGHNGSSGSKGAPSSATTTPSPSSSALHVTLDQYAGATAKLFNNMITPASILGGAIIPIAFASGLDYDGDGTPENKFAKFLRKAFPFVSVASLASILISVMWSSVTVNQLTENVPAKAASVWDLLQRDFALEWAGVNSHFVLGMLGYMWLIATKAFFMSGQATPVFALAMSGMMALVSIVNRGVASGGSKAGQRFGASIVGLFQSYISLLWKRSRESFGPVEALATGVFVGSLIMYGRSVWDMIQTPKSSS